MSSQRFIYAVMAIPTDPVATKFYLSCAKKYSLEPGTFDPGQFNGCRADEIFLDPTYTPPVIPYPSSATYYCATAVPNNPNNPTCSAYPGFPGAPSPTAGAVSVYTYLNGIPLMPVTNTGTNIPLIGDNYPINLVWSPSNPPLTNNYAAVTVETSSGVPSYPTPNVQCSALVLVYDLAWIKTWADLDYFAPLSQGGIKSSIFLNQGKGNTCDPQGLFYISTGQLGQKGPQVPTLEEQWPLILSQFCAGTTSAPSGSSSPCQVGVNVGLNSCSNIFGLRTDGGINYCQKAYQNFINPPAGLDPAIPNAINTAMIDYCNSFPVVGGTPQAPPECYCVTPSAQTSYQTLIQQMDKLAYSLPTDPASSNTTPFGPIGCWYVPCTYGQSTTTLIPQNVLIKPSSCPVVCENIVKIFDTGTQAGTIDLSGANIEQTITCCTAGSCTVSPNICSPACASNESCVNGKCVAGQSCGIDQTDCPAGQTCSNGVCVTPCTLDSDCGTGSKCVNGACQKEKSFWSEYWIFIVVGLFLLFLLVITLFLIFL